jgi:TolB-like protein/tetratricopeptide (TPR) repeat protein
MEARRHTFGTFAFDAATGTLRRGDALVPLGGRAAAVLGALLDAEGVVVTKAELMERAWPDTIVEEGNLAVQVATLRKVLGTRPDGAEWVNTVARVGYRLVQDAGGTPLAGRASVAVLPFANLSGEPGHDYFVDGIVEDLITALSRFKTFAVVSRNSSFVFKDRPVDVRDAATALGVRYVLEGSMRRAGPRVRVNTRLVEGVTGAHLWAESFDGLIEDVFEVQDRIVESVIGLIEPQIRLAEIQRARRKRPDSLDAYDLYLRALPHLHGVRVVRLEQFDQAIELLEQAAALDPNFAPALALAAWAHEMRLTRGGIAPNGVDDAAAAVALVERALAADRNDGIVLAIAGIIRILIEGQSVAGMALIRQAKALNPNSLLIANIAGYAHFFCGEYDAAIESHARFLALSPHLPETFWSLTGTARCHLAAGRVEEALTWGLRGLEVSEGVDMTHCVIAAAYAHLGQLDEARAALSRARTIWPGLSLDTLLGRTGQPDGRDRMLVEGLRLAGIAGTVPA